MLDRSPVIGMILLIVFWGFGAGCTAPVDPNTMVPNLTRGTSIPGSVSVTVAGGVESHPGAKTTLMTDKAMKAAVESSLEKANVFSSVRRDGPGDYLLDVNFTYDEHNGAYEMLVETHAHWKLTRRSSNSLVWERTAHSKGQKTAFGMASPDSFLIQAEEDAAKDNIQTAIGWLQKATIPRE